MGDLISKKTPVTETSTTSVPSWVTAAGQNNINFANNIPGFTPYSGVGVAGADPLQQQAFGVAGGMPGQFSGDIQSALQGLQGGLNFSAPNLTSSGLVSDAQGLLSPYFQDVINANNASIDRQKAMAGQGVMSQAAQAGVAAAGPTMDDRAGLLLNDSNRNFEQIRASTNANTMQGAYNTALQTALGMGQGNQNAALQGAGLRNNTAGMIGNLASTGAGMGWNDVQGLLSAGGVGRGIDQQGRDFDVNQWMMGYQHPFMQLNAMNSALGGAKYDTTTTGTKEVVSSPLAQIAGMGLGLYGMGMNPVGSMINMGYSLLNGGNGYYGGSPTTNPNLKPVA